MRLKNATIAEYANIRVGLLSGALTAMLVMDAVAITLTVGILDLEFQKLQQIAITLFVIASATGIALFFLARRYIDSITYRFAYIEEMQLEAISRIAKRFFLPFMMCLCSNIFLATTGALVLLAVILS